jgi:hypothetical protein
MVPRQSPLRGDPILPRICLRDGNEVGNTKLDAATVPTSNTGSYFLSPGTYTVEAGETDLTKASTPMTFTVETAKVKDLNVLVGAAK